MIYLYAFSRGRACSLSERVSFYCAVVDAFKNVLLIIARANFPCMLKAESYEDSELNDPHKVDEKCERCESDGIPLFSVFTRSHFDQAVAYYNCVAHQTEQNDG